MVALAGLYDLEGLPATGDPSRRRTVAWIFFCPNPGKLTSYIRIPDAGMNFYLGTARCETSKSTQSYNSLLGDEQLVWFKISTHRIKSVRARGTIVDEH